MYKYQNIYIIYHPDSSSYLLDCSIQCIAFIDVVIIGTANKIWHCVRCSNITTTKSSSSCYVAANKC